MMLAPLRPNTARRAVSSVKFVPGPTGGWNARDAVFKMKPEDAIRLDNMIVDAKGIRVRDGNAVWVSGLSSPVETLMEYAPPSGDRELFAATETAIYDATVQGARDPISDAVVSSLTNGRWQHWMFSNLAGNFLVCCNGADDVRNYNGSSWTTPSITGVASSSLVTGMVHQSRQWFIEKDSLSVWYLGTNAISGAATEINFAPACKLGGSLLACASWTRDGGSGMDDLAVFVTDQGEVLVYSGTDPASPTTFSRVGIFKIAEPIGRRCLIKAGSDLGVMTSQGLLPLSSILPQAEAAAAKTAATDKVSGAFVEAYQRYKSNYGWQPVEYPKGQLLIVNVPVGNDDTSREPVQFVMNTQTGKWSRFLDMHALCFGLMGDQLFWGSTDGRVWRYGEGVSMDDIEPIEFISISAFNSMGSARSKTFKRIKPQIFGPSTYRVRTALALDYDVTDRDYTVEDTAAQGSAIWDEAVWNAALWAPMTTAIFRWQGISGVGVAAAVVVAGRTELPISYNGSLLMYEPGGMV